MLKHIFAMVMLSMAIIFFRGWSWLHQAFLSIIDVYDKLGSMLHGVLPGGMTGMQQAQSLLLMLLVPLLLAGAIAAVYYLFKKRFMPEFITVAWLFWSLLVVMLSLTKHTGA